MTHGAAKAATPFRAALNRATLAQYAMDDRTDFEDFYREFVCGLEDAGSTTTVHSPSAWVSTEPSKTTVPTTDDSDKDDGGVVVENAARTSALLQRADHFFHRRRNGVVHPDSVEVLARTTDLRLLPAAQFVRVGGTLRLSNQVDAL